MYRFIETIRIDQKGPGNLPYHNDRLNRTRQAFFHTDKIIDINDHLKKIPSFNKSKIIRCTIHYDREINEINFLPYQKKTIHKLKLIYNDTIDYPYKYEDRNELLKLYSMKQDCDEIIIIKNGFISDTSYANLVFYDGSGYFTPSTPLLKGTMRAYLLEKGMISEKKIRPEDLKNYSSVGLINAMLNMTDYKIDINNIIP